MSNKFLILVTHLISFNCFANEQIEIDLLQNKFEHNINEQRSINSFAQNLKNFIVLRDVNNLKKIVSYEGCPKTVKDDCLSETLDTICSSDKKYIADNGSICNLLLAKHIETVVFITGASKQQKINYLITYYDRDFINLKSDHLNKKRLSLALKNYKAIVEIPVKKTTTGQYIIPYFIVESESYWQPN